MYNSNSKQYYYLEEAIKEAQVARLKNEVPIGAVIVYKDKIIARAYNMVEETNKSTAHAEILAINKAEEVLNNQRLSECQIYVTLEPCLMCMGAILQARIKHLYFGAYDTKQGAISYYNLKLDINIKGGIYEDICRELIQNFFKDLRRGGGCKDDYIIKKRAK